MYKELENRMVLGDYYENEPKKNSIYFKLNEFFDDEKFIEIFDWEKKESLIENRKENN